MLSLSVLLLPNSLTAQKVYTDHDYAQAEQWMDYNVDPLVNHTVSDVQFLPDGRVFYHDKLAKSTIYILADPAKGTQAPAFDNARLAEALRTASGLAYQPNELDVTDFRPDESGGFHFTSFSQAYQCTAAAAHCTKKAPAPSGGQSPPQKPDGQPLSAGSAATTGNAQIRAGGDSNAQSTGGKAAATAMPPRTARRRGGKSKAAFDVSPDGKSAVFIRDWNLWFRDQSTGEERALTTDGVKDFGYATDNAGWTHSDAPIVVWSPDSKKVATFQLDQRKTGLMYLVPVTNRHPELQSWHYPLLGDKDVPTLERVVIDTASGATTRLKTPPDAHRSTLCDDISCRGGAGWDDVQFASDGRHLAFVSTSRDHKDEWLRVADTTTGEVRTVYHEHVPTYYESGQGKVNWRYLPDSNEFLWYSERSNWGQMYLYDLTTGKLKNEITSGDGPVTEVLHVDAAHRVLYFLACGKNGEEDPYDAHYYRVNFDGTHQQSLTPEIANHEITPSPDGSTFVDIYSTVGTPKIAVLRDNTGKVLVPLAQQDISALLAAGWQAPARFTVKARDGKTPLYGSMWKPTTFDEKKKYPLVDYVYAGPYAVSCGPPSFGAAVRDNQALADLGFIVVCINGTGTPFRSKSFHDLHASTAADTGDDTIPDQVAGIKELASRFAWIDIDRVGIWGHSGGGNATANAMFHFPDFFKVGWSESGNHDNREYEDDWDEKWGGLEVVDRNGKSNYDEQANQNYAANLKGHLMLVHGTMDDNVPMNNTLLVVDALIKANKNFDLIMVPNMPHAYGADSPYIMRRRWDYFVRYLAGGVPPENYKMSAGAR